tara:strand:+ start:486 stop:761 length:276 start_codon:yes stop_codon:yes gene_type:complete
MGVAVRVPTPLRRLTDGADKVEANGSDLAEVIEHLDGQYNGFKGRLVDENGALREFVNIYLNGEDVRFLDGTQTQVSSGDEISIVPAVAGG